MILTNPDPLRAGDAALRKREGSGFETSYMTGTTVVLTFSLFGTPHARYPMIIRSPRATYP